MLNRTIRNTFAVFLWPSWNIFLKKLLLLQINMNATKKGENEKTGSIYAILASLDGSPIFNYLITDWELLARKLGVPASIIQYWRFHILVNELTPQKILEEILLNWKGRCGEEANLVSLIRVLEEGCKWLNICGELEARMEAVQKYTIVENTLWADLPNCVKGELLSKEVKFLGVRKPLLQIIQFIPEITLRLIFQENLKGITLINLACQKEFEIATNGFPDSIPFYMERRLSTASEKVIGEEEMIDAQFGNHKCKSLVCITGSPGMGKSVFMARLARTIQTKYADRVVIFLKMQHLVQELSKYENKEWYGQVISDLLADTDLGKKILLEIFSNSAYHIELFLDGCDEVFFQQQNIVQPILKYILKSFSNVRVVITLSTGPHFKYEEIKNRFDTIVYNIQEYGEAEKVQFLMNYWNRKFSFEKNEYLEGCAESALHLWVKNQRSEEASKFGTPLQLRLMAEVVADNVQNFYFAQRSNGKRFFDCTSYFQVFRSFMNRLFENDYNIVKAKHTRLAVMSLFPEISKDLFAYCSRSMAPIDPETVQKIGLLCADRPKHLNALVFSHKTFAEYLFAEFFVDTIVRTQSHSDSIYDICSLARFLFQTISCPDDNSVSFQQYSLCYFLDGFVQTDRSHLTTDQETDNFRCQLPTMGLDEIPNMADILQACIYHEYFGLFCFIVETFLSGREPEAVSLTKNLAANHDDWIRILGAASRMGLLNSIAKLYESFKSFSNWRSANNQLTTQLSWKRMDSQCTPLHIAAAQGNFQLFQYFLPEMGIEVMLRKPNLLLHATVQDSYFDSTEVINGKLEIIKFLLENNNPSIILHERSQMIPEPLLMECIHIRLLEFLIGEGADIFWKTPADKNNLAHNIADYMTPDEYHCFIKFLLRMKAGRIFGWRNVKNETALQKALRKMKVKSETLELLIKSNEVSTNSRYGYKDSLIYHLVKNGYTQKWLALVTPNTPQWPRLSYYNKEDSHWSTVLHVAVHWQNVEAVRFFLSLSADPNASDEEGKTPLHVACLLESFAKPGDQLVQIISLLIENRADVKLVDRSNRQPLSYLFD